MDDLTGLDLRGEDPRRFDRMIARAKRDFEGFDNMPDLSPWLAIVNADFEATGWHEGIHEDDFEIFLFLFRSARTYDGIKEPEEDGYDAD